MDEILFRWRVQNSYSRGSIEDVAKRIKKEIDTVEEENLKCCVSDKGLYIWLINGVEVGLKRKVKIVIKDVE